MERIELSKLREMVLSGDVNIVKIPEEEFEATNNCKSNYHGTAVELTAMVRHYVNDFIDEEKFNEMQHGVVYIISPDEMREWLDKYYAGKHYCAGCVSNIFNEKMIMLAVEMTEINYYLDKSQN